VLARELSWRVSKQTKTEAHCIEDSFLQAALEDGTTLKTFTTYADNEREEDDADKEREASGWYGLHRFFGMYVVNSTQYGEGQDLYGPFAKKTDAEAVLDAAVEFETMPGDSVAVDSS
jgi:hypothetical protein